MRGAAVFFLLFTCADIALPQYFCSDDEIGGVTLKGSATTPSAAVDVALDRTSDPATTDDSDSGWHEDQAPHEEDCFCCCAHVLPSMAFTPVGTSEMRLPSRTLVKDSLPSPPLRGTYHPPRIA